MHPHLAVNDVSTSRGLPGRPAKVEKINDIHPCDLVSVGLLSTVVQKVYLSTSLTNGVVLENKPAGCPDKK